MRNLLMPRPTSKRPFRIVDLMTLVAATAVAFGIFRYSLPSNIAMSTFGTAFEQRLFYWAHALTPFLALWALAVVAIAWWDGRRGNRRETRLAGVVACCAATGAIAIAVLIFCVLYTAHVLEDQRLIPRIFSHPIQNHPLPPFGAITLEEIGGAAVLGAWSALGASRRWRTDRTWIDRFGRLVGLVWITLFVIYIHGYAG
jgi:hypothetical protein